MFSHTWQPLRLTDTRLYSGAALTLLGPGGRSPSAHTASAKKLRSAFYSPLLARRFIAGIASRLRWPNKAPEPTRTSVTPRAFVSAVFARLAAARGAPAVRVAHL